MTIAFIIVLVLAAILGIALYFQMKASRGQATEQQQLLNDYQRRVDEQQKLLDDYRALEKNFDSVGEGYEQALLAFDKIEEDTQKMKNANATLEQRCASLQESLTKLQEANQKRFESIEPILNQLYEAGKTDPRFSVIAGRLTDLDDVLDNLPPLNRKDNVMVQQVADEAVRLSGIATSQYVKFQLQVAPDAAATMLSTNLQKAVRALTHLLDNSLKFTSDGTVTLDVTVDMEKLRAYYSVTDTGSGIEAAEAERIFEPYVKLNQFFDGQGIGLTVARNIARRLDGDVIYDATFAGPGARFVLELPI